MNKQTLDDKIKILTPEECMKAFWSKLESCSVRKYCGGGLGLLLGKRGWEVSVKFASIFLIKF